MSRQAFPQCRKCEANLISQHRWKDLSRGEREVMWSRGTRCTSGRGLCMQCYEVVRSAGRLHEYERLSVPRDTVLSEFELVTGQHSDLSMSRRISFAASRMGMTPAALERAIYRARKAAS